jgi:hypothetical protein
MQSTTNQKATKIGSAFITFHPNGKSKAICSQSCIDNFKRAVEDAGTLVYPTGGVVMRT